MHLGGSVSATEGMARCSIVILRAPVRSTAGCRAGLSGSTPRGLRDNGEAHVRRTADAAGHNHAADRSEHRALRKTPFRQRSAPQKCPLGLASRPSSQHPAQGRICVYDQGLPCREIITPS